MLMPRLLPSGRLLKRFYDKVKTDEIDPLTYDFDEYNRLVLAVTDRIRVFRAIKRRGVAGCDPPRRA